MPCLFSMPPKRKPAVFKKKPCSSETKPIHTKLAAWIRRMVTINEANGSALKEGLLLSQKELDNLHLTAMVSSVKTLKFPLTKENMLLRLKQRNGLGTMLLVFCLWKS